jgi:hypothetical protein
VDLGVQGLHAAVEDLGRAGDVRHLQHGDAGILERGRRTSGRDHFDTHVAEGTRIPALSETLIKALPIATAAS